MKYMILLNNFTIQSNLFILWHFISYYISYCISY